ncbi:MAG: HD domain-containing protein [Oscillospiraceae bacterium]|jgi:uncharacterized protein|nr:HD domain-containing protein [Oscillospiraceae bacterium]
MNRVEVLRNYIDKTIQKMKYREDQRCAYVHLYGVSHFCALIALKRNQDAELATIAGMLHDFYTYKMMDAENHAQEGALLAKETLDLLNITNEEETKLICEAILHHSNKKGKHTDFTEVLVDADTLQFYLYNIAYPPHSKSRTKRVKKLMKEFGIDWGVR